MSPLSIVIITLNEERRIGRLLSDLSTQSYQDFEVIVVDSDSEDATCQVAEEFSNVLPALTIHKMDKRGVSLGRNVGAGLAKHERILFLDADVRLSANFLSRAMEKLAGTRLEVAGVYLGLSGLPMMYKLAYSAVNAGMFATQYGYPTAVGACIFSTRRAHNHIGGFDQEISLCEDCDYVNRLSKTFRFRFIPVTFEFDSRRLEQDGLFSTGLVYLKANIRRFFFGEIRNKEVKCEFGHYKDQQA